MKEEVIEKIIRETINRTYLFIKIQEVAKKMANKRWSHEEISK